MKKGDRVQSRSLGGQRGVVQVVSRKSREAVVLFGVSDGKRHTKHLPWSDLYSEIPHTITEEPDVEVSDVQAGGAGALDGDSSNGRTPGPSS